MMLALFLMMGHDPYPAKVNKELARFAEVLGQYQHRPPQDSTEAEDSMYVTRGEVDIVIVQQKLVRYQHHQIGRADVEYALRQLRRDIEDVPAVDDPRIRN